MVKEIKIGTRGSALALWQSRFVKKLLNDKYPHINVEIITISTTGDRDTKRALSSLGVTGVFTAEIENSLLAGEVDIAVHSYKDLATVVPEGLKIAAVLKREDFSDSFITKDLVPFDKLKPGSVIGTSSLRRRAMLLNIRKDLEIINLRGNVHTRLNSVGFNFEDGKKNKVADATIMATAGLKRLGLANLAVNKMNPDIFLPAPAQGAIAVEMRSDNFELSNILNSINDRESEMTTLCERTFMNKMEGGCQLPIGALATFIDSQNINLRGAVLSIDGGHSVTGSIRGKDPVELGILLADELKNRGAGQIINDVKIHLENI
ncbi:MAG: hydroxymethylbilane synthase [Deltaproteobacteria bacterium]|nr:hydroxymethylbilane synthase [Deltaproteobacteria bacterium]